MKTRIIATTLVATGLALSFNAASASDELGALLVLGGSGAVIGHALGGPDAAVAGGLIGAMLGVAIADDDDRYRHRYSSRYPRYHRAKPPVYVISPPSRYYWRHEWHHRGDWRWDRDWRDDRRDWRDRSRDRRDDRRDDNRRGRDDDRRGGWR